MRKEWGCGAKGKIVTFPIGTSENINNNKGKKSDGGGRDVVVIKKEQHWRISLLPGGNQKY